MQVHGHAPGERAALAGDDGLAARRLVGGAGRAQIAVGIADRGHGDAGRALGGPGGVIADGFAARHGAHLHDARLQFDHRAHRIALPRGRIDAVERDARAHHVAMGACAREKCRRNWRARRGCRDRECAPRGIALICRALSGCSGSSAQARWLIKQRDAVVLGADARRERGRFVHRNAEPVHAGVDMQRGAAVPIAARCRRRPTRRVRPCCRSPAARGCRRRPPRRPA